MSANDFIDSLERELRAASRRRVRLELARAPRPGAGAVAFAVALAVCAAVAVPLLATRSSSAPEHQPQATPPAAHGVVVACDHAVYGQLRPGWRSLHAGTVVAGTLAWVYLLGAANPAAINRSHFVESLAVVNPGPDATVFIPRTEAGRLSLDYTSVTPRRRFYVAQGVSSVTFKPCPRGRNYPAGFGRQFEGGFIVSGPQCAEVDVHLAGWGPVIRRFIPMGRPCLSPALKVLSGNGVGRALFGDDPRAVVSRLRELLGHAPTKPYQRANVCRIDGEVGWPGLAVYFRHGRFVGYSYAERKPAGSEPLLGTLRGLQVGDTLLHGRQLYGSAFKVSPAQGGNWSVKTPQGRIDGYTSDVTNPHGKVLSIDAGYVGCPALTP